jgi:predicted dehydrogenase
MLKTHNVGILGFGFIGKVHAYGHLNLPFFYDPLPLRTRITHVCTSRAETAEVGCALVHADVATTDYRAITENPDIDIVHICTPNHLHKEALLSAMAHQKHIYCDKPLVADSAETAVVKRALADYRGTAQMTFQIRFSPGVMRAKQLIEEGRLGRILEYRAEFLHSGSADPEAPLKWKLSAEAGGGVIADLASHVLDVMHYLAGDYRALTATTSIAFPERPLPGGSGQRAPVAVEDCVMLLTQMANGATGFIEGTKIATGSEDELRFEIHGTKGALRYNQMHPHFLEFFDATAAGEPLGGVRGWTQIAVGQRFPPPANGFPAPKAAVGWMRGHIACLANFLYDVAAGRPGSPGLAQGIYVQELMDACRRSARERQWVNV